ncbi:MAG: hypothetical protein JST39_02050 [Bacteroidetes bacterium]|nr:hypothetical protein [Bacteroidota bacterium]
MPDTKPTNDFKVLQLLHMALLTGMAALATIATIIVVQRGALSQDASLGRILQVVVVALSVGGVLLGFNLFNRRMKALNPMLDAKSKMAVYRSAAIVRWALLEMPAMFTLISFLLTGNYAFLALGIALLLIFVVVRPAKQLIIFLLQLNEQEVAELEGPSA